MTSIVQLRNFLLEKDKSPKPLKIIDNSLNQRFIQMLIKIYCPIIVAVKGKQALLQRLGMETKKNTKL